MKLDQTLRIGEAAKLFGVTPMTLRRWEQAGVFKPLRIGPREDRRYKKEDILRVLEHGLNEK